MTDLQGREMRPFNPETDKPRKAGEFFAVQACMELGCEVFVDVDGNIWEEGGSVIGRVIK